MSLHPHRDKRGFITIRDGDGISRPDCDLIASVWEDSWLPTLLVAPEALDALEQLVAYLAETPHHNAPEAAFARQVLRRVEDLVASNELGDAA